MTRRKVLNLYAGIGGNRKHWENVTVTAIEHNQKIADCYQDHYPQDTVIVTDAHDYLQNHYLDNWDFIWASPPCPTHSKTNFFVFIDHQQSDQHVRTARYPDMRLYEEIIFLQTFAPQNTKWAIENVKPYYDPLIRPQYLGRHAFWTNYYIEPRDIESPSVKYGSIEDHSERHGFDLSGYSFDVPKRKVLRNCVDPELSQYVFESAFNQQQTTLPLAATDGGNTVDAEERRRADR